MSNHRYSPEFKDEAVRQIIEAGHSVSDVAARLGVSTNSLYKWVTAVQLPGRGVIRSRRHCGGLHHECYRRAA